ncbi:MAG: LysR family transcriptional regulator [Enterocloster sp.]
METKLIEYILTIAKYKSVSRAAEELYVTQSA